MQIGIEVGIILPTERILSNGILITNEKLLISKCHSPRLREMVDSRGCSRESTRLTTLVTGMGRKDLPAFVPHYVPSH